MTVTDHAAAPATAPAAALSSWFRARPRLLLGLAIAAAACLGQFTALARFRAVWSVGAFFDTDDAMRAVQVRDLMAGQAWFDMTQYRLDPPVGVFMHWSRVVDVPLVLLNKAFGLIVDPATAERLARLAFPFFLTVALFALSVRLCEMLLGRNARWPALAATFLYGPATGQFEPGRIDHHAPQIVLLLLALTTLCHAVVHSCPRWATLAGAAIAVSMAISIENIPFFAPLLGMLVLLWVFDADRFAPVLSAFAAGLGVALPVVYAATIAPSRYLLSFGDALSAAQACALLAFAAFAAVLAMLPRRMLGDRLSRFTIASMGIIVMAFALARSFPELAKSPFADLDPLIRTFWLDGVQEALPLHRKFAEDPFAALAMVAPALIGAFGLLYAAATTRESKRQMWLVLAVTAAGGLAASLMMVRTMSAVLALVIPGMLFVALRFQARATARVAWMKSPLALCVILAATSAMGWVAACTELRVAIAAMQMRIPTSDTTVHDGLALAPTVRPADFSRCTEPEAFAALAKLPPGLVLAEPDLGAYILAHTPHAVVAGAYHRNVEGMRRAIEALIAPSDRARDVVAQTGADYIVYCRSAADPQFVHATPDGLAAQLADKRIPKWLRQASPDAGTLDILAVSKARISEKK